MRVLITDDLAPTCLQRLADAGLEADVQLKKSPEELKALAAGAAGWIIRSGTTITADLLAAAAGLKVIGRAGVGVDNVDLEAATRRGVLVVNAPDGNTVSTAEHTCAMILALARRIPQAHAALAAGRWERKPFSGAELDGKTLGVVGVGKVGRAVAERMRAFGMEVIGFDPVLSVEAAERAGIEPVALDEIWRRSDVITFHSPLNDATRGLLNADTLARCKDGVRVVNCARGGIVDEADLLDALQSGKVAGAALDVFSSEPPGDALAPLLRHPNVVVTPHIAASTDEAQEKVAVQITEEVVRALRGQPVLHPVNAAAIRMAAQPEVAPYLDLAVRLGRIAAQLVDGPVARVVVGCAGETAGRYAEVLSVGALAGVLARWSEEPINLVNAPALAHEMGLRVEEQRRADGGDFANLIEVTLETAHGSRTVRGTVLGREDLRLVGLDGFPFEVRPEGHLLFYQNVDRPGVLATVGALLAEAGINIAGLALGREAPGATALTVLTTDEPIPAAVVRRIAGVDEVHDVRVATV
ncbi:MAG TPA: phosphoglycerate dehydrogenase [Rubricoccaceae bacterium]|nr:phosphoglycerate dehydrogenase [Rubricoccaceae bacterium]